MKVLFITNTAQHNCVEPLGMMYLSALLQGAGHETLFASACWREAARAVRNWQPDIVGYTASMGEHRDLLRLNRRLKQAGGFFSIFGGPHPTFRPELVDDASVDAVCVGEGEGAMLEVAGALEAGRSIEGIANVCVKNGERGARCNEVRPLIEDLDSLPFPDRASFYRIYNRPKTHGIAHFIAGRGCPFSCTFCFNREYFAIYRGKGSRVRFRSPENVVAEVEETLCDYPFQVAMFCDDVFPWKKEWLEKFVPAYRTRVGVSFICNQRVEHLDGETCRLLKEAGCHTVLIGIESGNETLRRDVLNRRMTNEQIRTACRNLHEAGLRITSTNIVGFPEDTVATAMDTLRLNAACEVDLANASFCQPYPGTVLGAKARALGLIDDEDAACSRRFLSRGRGYRIQDKRKLGRLRALRGPAVGMRFLVPALPFLIRLPLGALYAAGDKLWSASRWALRVYPIRLSPVQYARIAFRYLFR